MPESRARVLLERDADLATVDAAIDSVHGGDGALVVIQGPAGIGKTELLDASCERASSVGLSVAGARGPPLERDLAYGVVRQLFEPLLHRAADVPALLDGAAGLAAPVLHVPNGH